MMISDILDMKRAEIKLHRDDLVSSEVDPLWRTKHPLGPVHFRFRCACCQSIVLEDQRECDLTDPIWAKLTTHLEEHR